MFGLEGSGFIISVAMTFFLVGLVMYYVRQRLNDQEKQLNQLVSIIPVMSQQLQIHDSIIKTSNPSISNQEEIPGGGESRLPKIPEEHEKINVSDGDADESDETDSAETDSEETDSEETDSADEVGDCDVKNIQLGNEITELTVADIETELGNQLHAMAMQGGVGQVRVVAVHTLGDEAHEPLANDPHNIEILDESKDAVYDENESDKGSDSDSDSESEDETDSEDDEVQITIDETTNSEEVNINVEEPLEDSAKMVKTNNDNKGTVNYSKMAVAAIREIVVSKGLADAAKAAKLNKKKLLELLK